MKTMSLTEVRKHTYIFIAVLVFMSTDVLLLLSSDIKLYYITKLVKGLTLLYLIYFSLSYFDYIRKAILLSLVFIFISSQFLLWYGNDLLLKDLLSNGRFFLWYISVLILSSLFLNNKTKCTTKELKLLNRFGYGIIIIVCLFIIIGLVFDLDFFRTYRGSRWGYKGIMGKSVTLSYFFIVSLFFVYYQYIKKRIKVIYFLMMVICSLFSGTKTVYLFILLLFSFHLFYKKYYKNYLFYVYTVIASSLIYFFRDFILLKSKFFWQQFYDLYLKKGLAYSFTSYRSEMLVDGINSYIEQWRWYNYLIGGRLINIKYFEMTFFDLIVFWGLIGTILYIYFTTRYILIPFVKDNNKFGIFIMLSLLLASFFTGQFLINSTAVIVVYYYLMLFSLNDSLIK